MTAVLVAVPVQIPGEDLTHAPFAPRPATMHVAALPNRAAAWDDMAPEEQLRELRRGASSIYYSEFEDDPTCWADCPRDGRVAVGADGQCLHCGREVPAMKWVTA